MSYVPFHDEEGTGNVASAPGKPANDDSEKVAVPIDDVPPAYAPPADQSYLPYTDDGRPLQEMSAIPRDVEPGVIYTPTRRMRAQPRHVLFVVFTYAVYAMFDQSFIMPLPLAGFICALVALWKQERADPKTSNILGIIAMVIAGLSLVLWVVLLTVDMSILFPQLMHVNYTRTATAN